MCGRFAFTDPKVEKIKKRFKVQKISCELKPRYNISPHQDVLAILNNCPDEVAALKWGFIPNWVKSMDKAYKMINARAETIHEKPSFKHSFQKKRCLILADSFYEWKKEEKGKQPYRILMKDEEPFAMAGIWSACEIDGRKLRTCAIITTEANKMMFSIHDRMPVIIPPQKMEEWLVSENVESISDLLKPYPSNKMRTYTISTDVNSPQNDTADIIQPWQIN